jgi:hypothetical protein
MAANGEEMAADGEETEDQQLLSDVRKVDERLSMLFSLSIFGSHRHQMKVCKDQGAFERGHSIWKLLEQIEFLCRPATCL